MYKRQYTDTATYTDTGSRKWDWEWKGVDGNSPNSNSPVGPNLLGASLTATLLDITYTPISEETEEQLEDTNELLELGLLPSVPFHSQSHFLEPVSVYVAVSVYV